MDARRRHYLDALGVQVYRSQAAAPEPVPVPAAPVGAAPLRRDEPLDWQSLKATVAACTACALHGGRTQTVFGTGDPSARWMVVGEAPGAEEDRRGEPFVGRAGQLLDAMLAAAGAPRERVYIANTVKCRPPDNRNPTPAEAAACRAFLDRQIELVQPALILAVGAVAAHTLLGVDTQVGKLRGEVHRYGERGIPLVVTYHPAYVLRSPGQKRRAWDDLKLALTVAAPLA